MTTNTDPAPLEIAHLAVRLHASGLAKTEDFSELCATALVFLEHAKCILDQTQLVRSRSKKLHHNINQLIEGKAHDLRLPIADVLKCAGVNRIKLRPGETPGSIKWEEMKPSDQHLAIFNKLLSGNLSPPARQDYAKNGIPVKNVNGVIERIIKAHDERKSEMNREAGRRKKPRAPQGEGGKFESKKRAPSGRWRKQS